ncbi:hypothetical protein CBL_12215 [Carabus blaptoides fortunei]
MRSKLHEASGVVLISVLDRALHLAVVYESHEVNTQLTVDCTVNNPERSTPQRGKLEVHSYRDGAARATPSPAWLTRAEVSPWPWHAMSERGGPQPRPSPGTRSCQ